MKNSEKNKTLDRMFCERLEIIDRNNSEIVFNKEKQLHIELENRLKRRYKENDSELFDILEDISNLCNINSKIFYKLGVIDGFKLNEEMNDVFSEIDD